MKYAEAPAMLSSAAEMSPPVEDSATATVSRRFLKIAAILSACGIRSCIRVSPIADRETYRQICPLASRLEHSGFEVCPRSLMRETRGATKAPQTQRCPNVARDHSHEINVERAQNSPKGWNCKGGDRDQENRGAHGEARHRSPPWWSLFGDRLPEFKPGEQIDGQSDDRVLRPCHRREQRQHQQP